MCCACAGDASWNVVARPADYRDALSESADTRGRLCASLATLRSPPGRLRSEALAISNLAKYIIRRPAKKGTVDDSEHGVPGAGRSDAPRDPAAVAGAAAHVGRDRRALSDGVGDDLAPSGRAEGGGSGRGRAQRYERDLRAERDRV